MISGWWLVGKTLRLTPLGLGEANTAPGTPSPICL